MMYRAYTITGMSKEKAKKNQLKISQKYQFVFKMREKGVGIWEWDITECLIQPMF